LAGHLVLVLLALFAAACAPTQVQTEVTAFHTLPDAPRGKTFVMVPYKNQDGSLEWQSYSNLVARQLQRNGMVRVQSISEADFAVFMAYAIDGGRTSVSSVPVFGQTGGGTTTTTTGFVGSTPVYGTTYTPPTYGVMGYAPVEDTVYGRAVKIVMVDVKRTTQERGLVTVYEATATSSGSIGNLNVVMPAIVAGTFKDWPGPPGATRRHAVPLEGEN
jgi:hypothetical protein